MDEKRTPGGQFVTPAGFTTQAEGWARELETREQVRTGNKLEVVRPIVSRKTGVPLGTLRSLRKRRLKDVSASTYEGLKAAMVRELLAEMRRHEAELQQLIQTGADPRADEISEIETSLACARKALGIEG